LRSIFLALDKKKPDLPEEKIRQPSFTYFNAVEYGIRRIENTKVAREPETVFSVEKAADRVLFNRFVPASIVVNEEWKFVHFRERLGLSGARFGPSDIQSSKNGRGRVCWWICAPP